MLVLGFNDKSHEKTIKERRGKKMDNLYAKDFKDNLKKTLRNVRLACGFSQDEVAKVLQVNRATYTYYENGKTTPDVQALRILAEFYGISAVVFMFPEKYAGMDVFRLKSKIQKHPLPDPRRFGELTQEEKDVVKAYRLKKKGSAYG